MAEKKKIKISLRVILSVLFITVGALLIAIPIIKDRINQKRSNDVIEEFLRQAELAAVTAVESADTVEVEDFDIPFLDPEEPITETPEPTEPSEPAETPTPQPTKKPRMSTEEIQRRTTGVLIIPKIDVKMLIMDGTDDATLLVAAGRLTMTGNFDEVGNVVLAGHRSHTYGKYLNRLNELETGDKITVQLKDKTLTYTVYKSHIIEPNDFSILNQSDTDKVLTLFTCDPPGIGSHRLVVHAKQDE